MSGKGSKRRPFAVSNKEDYIKAHENFNSQWDIIFGGKNIKHEKNKTEISVHLSHDNERRAEISHEGDSYIIDFYLNEKLVDVMPIKNKKLQYAEDIAEDYILGRLSPTESRT